VSNAIFTFGHRKAYYGGLWNKLQLLYHLIQATSRVEHLLLIWWCYNVNVALARQSFSSMLFHTIVWTSRTWWQPVYLSFSLWATASRSVHTVIFKLTMMAYDVTNNYFMHWNWPLLWGSRLLNYSILWTFLNGKAKSFY